MEIDKVTGRQRKMTFADRESMPYMEAVVHEVFRFCNFTPFLLPHSTTEDLDFEGYVLPKGRSKVSTANLIRTRVVFL